MQVPEDDRPINHYTPRHRAVAWISQRLFDNVTYTVHHGLLAGMKRKGGLGWAPAFLRGDVNLPEHRFLESLDLKDQIVYDIGAFQGLMTMFFARRAKHVICYEPNSTNRARLLENLRLNGLTQVTVRPVGLGSQPQSAAMAFIPLMPGGASIESKAAANMRADTSSQTEQIEITTLDLDRAANQLPKPDFMKIDIEGYEIEALKGATETLREHRPRLMIELHGETRNEKRRNVAAVVGHLHELGYSIRHVESGRNVTPDNSAEADEGHLYCE